MPGKGVPQALKRNHILNALPARVELVPFPKTVEAEFRKPLA
jgi:hypothetical protein